MGKSVIWVHEPACCEVIDAGGKGASLASMTQQNLPVPGGFAVSADIFAKSVDAEKLPSN